MGYSPGGAAAAGFTMKRRVCQSSARANLTGSAAGVTLHPGGGSNLTDASAGALTSLITVTRTSRVAEVGERAAAAPRTVAAGTIAISGDTRTEYAGTTSSSSRFSPLKMSWP